LPRGVTLLELAPVSALLGHDGGQVVLQTFRRGHLAARSSKR